MELDEVKKVAKYVDSISQYNLTSYCNSSLQRRFNTFLFKEKMVDATAVDVIAKIKNNPDYIQHLINEITVPTTEMFRNPSLWVSLVEMLMDNFSKATPLKILHNPCSTGEEVYTMSILLHELGYSFRDIIGVDINTRSLEQAKSAEYVDFLFDKNNKNYQEFKNDKKADIYKYFKYSEREESQFLNDQFKKRVTFYNHDNIEKFHINTFDIIFCRNLLIYFEDDLQEKFLKKLTAHLKVGGFLILGSYEIIKSKEIEAQYMCYNRHSKIYRKIK